MKHEHFDLVSSMGWYDRINQIKHGVEKFNTALFEASGESVSTAVEDLVKFFTSDCIENTLIKDMDVAIPWHFRHLPFAQQPGGSA